VAQTKKADTAKAASEAKSRSSRSRSTSAARAHKLYVRRNTHKQRLDGGEVFDATIEVPVTIRNPDKRIPAHLFTGDGAQERRACAGPRSRSTTGTTPKDALDRITIPQDVLDRIAPTALRDPRSSSRTSR
jgi:hypothetical protein